MGSRLRVALVLSLVLIAGSVVVSSGAPVPPAVRFGGNIAGIDGPAMLTFGLFADQSGGEMLWCETQSVTVDRDGRYTVLLGATKTLPPEIFASGDARWMEVRTSDGTALPRVLLVSVPYALKAGDADTIGGKPASAFVLASQEGGPPSPTSAFRATAGFGAPGASPQPTTIPTGGSSAGTANYLAMYTDAVNLGNSTLFQDAVNPATLNFIGVNTTTPLAQLHVQGTKAPAAFFEVVSNSLTALPGVYRAARGTPASPAAVQTDDILGGLAVRGYDGSAFTAGMGQVMFKAAENWAPGRTGTYLQFTTTPIGTTGWTEKMRITPAGNVGIGTTAPAQKLSVAGLVESTTGGFKFPDGTTQASAGSSLAANTFTATQTISSGNLALPTTTGSSSGVLTLGGQPFLHAAGATTYPNTFVGIQAGTFTGSGVGANVGVGYQALAANTSGAWNTAVGDFTLAANTSGTSNTAVGYNAMYHGATTGQNTAVGYQALGASVAGTYNSALGWFALANGSSGDYNSAFGVGALANTTASNTSAFGAYALNLLSTGTGNSAFGDSALAKTTTTGNNSGFGHQALSQNVSGASNSAFGSLALSQGADGSLNSAFGHAALKVAIGDENSAFGYAALTNLTSGYSNTAVGGSAMAQATTASDNVAIGVQALSKNNDTFNTAVGEESLWQALSADNTAVGYQTLYNVTSGADNTAVGLAAGQNLVSGYGNTFIGANARTDSSHPGLANSAAIGANAVVSQNNSMVLGDGTVSVGIGTSAPVTKLQVVGDIRVGTSGTNGCVQGFGGAPLTGTCSSDLRLKKDVEPIRGVLGKVAMLQPVKYRWRTEEFPYRHYGDAVNTGLIAQDVERVFPELVSVDEQGYKQVNYTELPYLTLQAVRELKTENDALKAENAEVKTRLAAQDAALKALAERLARIEKK